MGTLMAPYMKISRTWGENMFIYRVRYADSHGPHEKVTAPKKRRVMKEKLNLYIFVFNFLSFFLKFVFSVITHHYFNPVLFSCGPCDSA